MKKKFLTIMACFVMILVGGLTLAGCGGPTETEISSTDAQEFVNSQDLNSGFSGGFEAIMYGMMTTHVKFENGKVVALSYEANNGTDNFKFYITDNKAYLDAGEDNKVWTSLDTVADTEYAEQYNAIMSGLDVSQFTSMIKEESLPHCNKFVKKVDGNKTELVCQGESEGQPIELVLTFVDGKLQSVKGSQNGQEIMRLNTSNQVSIPDLSAFTEYQAPEVNPDPTTPGNSEEVA